MDSFEKLVRTATGICLHCGKRTKDRGIWRIDDRKVINYFDLCEDCKLLKNCFTCRYNLVWYVRYKGNCDLFFGTFEVNRADCNMYKTKVIGKTPQEFWDHPPCQRYQRGDPTKDEFDEWNYHD